MYLVIYYSLDHEAKFKVNILHGRVRNSVYYGKANCFVLGVNLHHQMASPFMSLLTYLFKRVMYKHSNMPAISIDYLECAFPTLKFVDVNVISQIKNHCILFYCFNKVNFCLPLCLPRAVNRER